MNYLRPNAQRAKTAIIILGIIVGLEFIMIISEAFHLELLKQIQLGNFTNAEIESNDLRQGILEASSFLVGISSVVTFIFWFRRAYNNLHQLSPSLEYGEGWAAGAWFIPFVNLVRPYKIMKELYVTSNKILIEKAENYQPLPSTSIVNIWWLFYIIPLVYAIFESISLSGNPEYTAAIKESYFTIGTHALQIISGIITIIVIKRYAILETQLLDIVPDNATQLSDSIDILD
jgi:hypothetical protein